MSADAVVRARIDEQTKARAAAILEASGLTTSTAIRMLLLKIVEEGALPFEPVRVNPRTLKAVTQAKAGRLKSVRGTEEFLRQMHEGH